VFRRARQAILKLAGTFLRVRIVLGEAVIVPVISSPSGSRELALLCQNGPSNPTISGNSCFIDIQYQAFER
jgi:hypothetical protein